ncbi:MAG: Exodeoxyribonuclease 7 small subunit [Verrucomicrobia subdivision 3 bacterium]|nr:Exodeoxyribonuclease 7 small subunit [Limisphaerales bacterium]MCS1416390.1 Exodeoxyribonuclease 7 small subunit [Limisphaerales bacterium]
MLKKSKSDDAPQDALSRLSYEEALKRLETIVEEMDGDDLALEKLISHYEEGMRLRKVCLDKLSEAEVKIKSLEESLEGEFSLKPLTLEEDCE